MKTRMLLTAAVVSIFLYWVSAVSAITWTTVDFPGAFATRLYDIDGSNIVGSRVKGGNDIPQPSYFIYNGSTWSTFPEGYRINGISGNNLVGYDPATMHGFLYDGMTWTTLYYPPYGAGLEDIDGHDIVGFFDHGVVYNTETRNWTTLDFPGTNMGTRLFGIDGGNIVGDCLGYGFLYNMESQTWTPLLLPGAQGTFLRGIDGSNIVGYTGTGHGIIYNIENQTWLTLDFPGATFTAISGIDGDT